MIENGEKQIREHQKLLRNLLSLGVIAQKYQQDEIVVGGTKIPNTVAIAKFLDVCRKLELQSTTVRKPPTGFGRLAWTMKLHSLWIRKTEAPAMRITLQVFLITRVRPM